LYELAKVKVREDRSAVDIEFERMKDELTFQPKVNGKENRG
jgi:hypothetical protein